MGGSGSGGWNHSGRATVEQTAKLGIAALQKARAFRPGAYTVWRWSVGERQCASIGVHGEHDAIRLSYSVSTEDQPHRVDERIALQRRPCPFGGERRLFCCPRCARAALNLHLRGGRFVCRVCARLTSVSTRAAVVIAIHGTFGSICGAAKQLPRCRRGGIFTDWAFLNTASADDWRAFASLSR